MSCRIAVNMARRAAAGTINVTASYPDEIDDPHPAADIASKRSRKLASRPVKRRYDLRRLATVVLCVCTVLGFASYGAYAHQWAELSALRHLGSPGK
jgi:hypothetical protein